MKNFNDYFSLWAMLFAILLMVTYFGSMRGCGYHMEWSWINGRWVWVDNQGKP